MKRVFPAFAYGPGPRAGCWWDETVAAPDWPKLDHGIEADVAIVGGGFTGMSAAFHLAERGCRVAMLEAQTPGWGASGRNGGFCCLGGAKTSNAALTRAFGQEAARDYWLSERAAVDLVDQLLDRLNIDADRHSNGETMLAHRPRDMERMKRDAEEMARKGEPEPMLIEAADLARHCMNGPFHGALTIPVGFALNPRKYLFGLADAAIARGAQLFQQSPATAIRRDGLKWQIDSPAGSVTADTVVIATNGYSSEDIPGWMAGRYLPSQSNVTVTRPLTDAEIAAQGWHSDQMAYDTRNLLHYFRLMPDRRFLFGLRGGVLSSPAAEARARKRNRRDFEQMFPAWRDVPSLNQWSGLVCLSRRRVPFVGPVSEQPGLYAGFAYHGNGVAMGSYSGRLLADLALSRKPDLPYSRAMTMSPPRFPPGVLRRLLIPAAYFYYALRDL
ncbi:NAD(P)/FAD-dependent oxidoreductase [Sedimentitalea todarodis]|uniref:FAD-dependent oxidoreductase n=1 Tax=Sedimentitalea todarodis TaxID=1631240 RepID=A0ABU3VDG8_9RHOB|nr:FAD-dependent oxidoreductase [Sedimentitalea todarodis]MDU9004222.1 FAD-dependent oxidoreductase [Sedimentitalea todarodis]